jgi:RNase H-fold protein (predicted Holliday junction resolvase)
MPRKEINILAVNPGTKYVGLAVLQGSDLIYWGVKVLKGKWSKDKMDNAKATLLNLIERYDISMIVLKRLNRSRSSRNLNRLAGAIERLAKKKRLRISLYCLSDLKKFFAKDMEVNKMDIAELVVARYLFLSYQLEKERKHKHPYFVRMFEAVAAGIFAISRFNR